MTGVFPNLRFAICIYLSFFVVNGSSSEMVHFNISNTIAFTNAEDILKLLESSAVNNDEHLGDMYEVFLKSFGQVWISLEWNNGADPKNQISELILRKIGNPNMLQKLQKPIEMFIHLHSVENRTTQITEILSFVKEINLQSSGMTLRLSLQTSRQNLNSDQISILSQDIQLMNQHISEVSEQTISLGVYVNAINCQKSKDFLKTLPVHLLDFITFHVSDERQEFTNEDIYQALNRDILEGFKNCSEVFKEIYPEAVSKMGILLNDHVTYTFNQSYLSQWYINNIQEILGNEDIKIILPVDVHVHKDKAYAVGNRIDSIYQKEVDNEWLNNERDFISNHVAFSVYYDYVNLNTTPILRDVFTHSSKVFIENAHRTNDESYLELSKAVKGLAEAKLALIYDDDVLTATNGDIALQIGLIIHLIENASNGDFGNEIMNALSAAKTGNSIFSNTVSDIIFNFGKIDDSVEYKLQMLSDYISNLSSISETERLKLGIMLPANNCTARFLKQFAGKIETLNGITFSHSISIESLTDVPGSASSLTRLFKVCRQTFYRETGNTNRIEFSYYIRLYGCSRTYTDVSQLSRYGRFLHSMRNWAVAENVELIVNTACEVTTADEDDIPDNNNSLVNNCSSREHCDCGWWLILNKSISGNECIFQDKKTFARQLYEKHSHDLKTTEGDCQSFLLWTLIPTILFVVTFSTPPTWLMLRYRSKYKLVKEPTNSLEMQQWNYYSQGGAKGKVTSPFVDGTSSRYEVPPTSFQIDESRRLGSGQFSTVYAGSILREGVSIQVAVKKIKNSSHSFSLLRFWDVVALMAEIKILSYVGSHKHIVCMEGTHTVGVQPDKYYLFLELCALGSLQKYLRSIEKDDEIENKEDEYENTSLSSCQKVRRKIILSEELRFDLSRWAVEIVDGMAYLHSKKVVHCDLATRNVLLTLDKTTKIADFGLSKRLYELNCYTSKDKCPLPWRWMAPESLRRLEFTEKSDIWAFGVTLWEMYCLGDVPYPGLPPDVNFSRKLENGLRLGEPRFDDRKMYFIMGRCWQFNPDKRPTFNLLKVMLEK